MASLDQAFRAVLFDMDGTLIDGRDPQTGEYFDIHIRSWEMAAERHQVDFDAEFHRTEMRGRTISELDQLYKERFNLEDDVSLYQTKQSIYETEMLSCYQWFLPGVEDFLAGLSAAQVPMAIVTNAPTSAVSIINETLWLERFFERSHILTCDQARTRFGSGKPDPAGLLAMISLLGVAPEEALYLGDSRSDILAANAAGVTVGGVVGGNSAQELTDLGADFVVASVCETQTMVHRQNE